MRSGSEALPSEAAEGSCGLEFTVTVIVDLVLAARHTVARGEVADGAVQTGVVVVVHEAGDGVAGLLKGGRLGDADGAALDGLVVALDFTVGLRIVGRGSDVGHAGDADEFLEVEFTVGSIVMPIATDGKFRVSSFKVLRKINRKDAIKLLGMSMGVK